MARPLRRYFETHRGSGPPLLELQDNVAAAGQPDAQTVRELSARLKLPPAALRSAASYFADLQDARDAVAVCQGTSCLLAGAAEVQRKLERHSQCRKVFCLGYCDRSPAVLKEGRVVTGSLAGGVEGTVELFPAQPSPPAIRSLVAEPIVTRRIGRGDYSSLAEARRAGVYDALEKALRQPPEKVIETMEASGERGRGGAGFPTGSKWRLCARAAGEPKYVVANGDEGDPGSFIDRVLMEQDPHAVLEGMILCAYAIGARKGVVFIRSEYPVALARMQQAIAEARQAGLLGGSVMGNGFAFDAEVFPGMGSYVCGEETAMLNAIEGFRGEVQLRPPYPAQSGLYARPTIVNNVETLVNVPWIVLHGAGAYKALGTRASSGTKALCFNQGFARPGIVEVEFGVSLREVIEKEAGGGRDGQGLEAVLLGGPMGSLLAPEEWEVPVCYRAMAQQGIQLGHGGLVAVPAGTDFALLLKHWLEFMQYESCGKCVPCRLGSQRALELVEQPESADRRAQCERLLEVMADASLCAFGQLMPGPMRQMINRFGDRIFPQDGR